MFWTLGPVADRPQSGHAQIERFAAFFVLALLWVSACPRRPVLVLAILSCGAAALEIGQGLVPGRDPGMPDVVAKIAGVACGVLMVVVVKALRRRLVGVSLDAA
jgi:VanZ family protein